MKKSYIWVVIFALAILSCTDRELDGITSGDEVVNITTDAINGELLIKFSPEMSDILDESLQMSSSDEVKTRSGIPSTDEVLDILGAYSFERVFPVDVRHEERTREAGLNLWYIVHFDEGVDLKEAIKHLKSLGEVSKVQCNTPIHRQINPDEKPRILTQEDIQKISSKVATRASEEFIFNDPLLPYQWGYINRGDYAFVGGEYNPYAKVIAGCDVGCEEAWKICTGDSAIIIGVIDDGIMYDHPDIAGNMWVNEGEEFGANRDADGNGYKDDKYGYNFVRDRGTITYSDVDDIGHGTHIAGTIAAVNNNGIGVCGIAGGDGTPNSGVRLMCLQLFDGDYVGSIAQEAKAMKYAADNGAVIIQCSWGYYSPLANAAEGYTAGPATEAEWESLYPLEKEALDYFIQNAGSPNGVIEGGLAIFASGNEFAAMSSFPAAYSKCVSVSALAADFTPASYTNYGTEVNFSTPGGDTWYYCIPGKDYNEYDYSTEQGLILSTIPGLTGQGPTYAYYEGTSMSCPHAVGVAALGLAYAHKLRRHFKAEEFIDLMTSTATDLDQYYVADEDKVYYNNPTSMGHTAMRVELSKFRGKMGKLPNAGALLNAIQGAGSQMKMPNVYVSLGKQVTTDAANYFVSGDNLSYQASVADSSIATIAISGTKVNVTGVAIGTTTATVTSSNGSTQTFVITVRNVANSNGWL